MDRHERPRDRPAEPYGARGLHIIVADQPPHIADGVAGGPVEDEAQRAFFIVLHHEHNGVVEVRVGQVWRPHKEMPAQAFHDALG